MYNVDFSILLKDFQLIVNGIYVTIFVSLVSSLLAFVLGTILVYFRTTPLRKVKKAADFLTACLRNTPLLILIYLFYKGLPSIHIVLSAMTCGIFALSIYTAAYISDALLSGMKSVPMEHTQASFALGLNRFQTFIYVIYPQAVRRSIFILGSQFMNLIKNSSLVSFIAVTDIFYVIYKGISDSYRIYEYFTLAIVVYCSLTLFVLIVVNILQKLYRLPEAEVRV